MEIEFSQKIGNTTIKLRSTVSEDWSDYQKASELWQQITEYELALLPEDQQTKKPFKKL